MKKLFQQTQTLYLALLAGQVLFAAVAFFLVWGGNEEQQTMGSLGILVPAIAVFSMLFMSRFIYNMRLQQGGDLNTLEEKILHYRSNSIIKWALLEGGTLIAIVFYLLEGNIIILAFVAVGLIGFLLAKPSPGRFADDYKLNPEERRELK